MDFQELITQYNSHYQIAILRVQQNKQFKEIAEIFQISDSRVRQKYRRFLWLLLDVYVKYIMTKVTDVDFESHIEDVKDFYYNNLYVVAYLENVYSDVLRECRKGVPPIAPIDFPYFRKISSYMQEKIKLQIVNARDIEKRDFKKIGRDLDLTREKVKRIYYSKYWR